MSRLSITQQFIGYLILLSILPLLAVGIISYQTASATLISEVSRYTLELVTNQRDHLDLQVEQVESLMSNISGVEEIRTVLEDIKAQSDTYSYLTTQAHIGYILNGFSDLRGLVSIDIFAVNGTHFHVGDTLNTDNIRVAQRDQIFAEALESGTFVTWTGIEDNINSNSQFAKVVTAAKVLYKLNRDTLQQEPVGLLIVNYDVEYIHRHLSQVQLDTNAYMMVADAKGRIIYHPDRALRGTPIQVELAYILRAEAGSTHVTLDDTPFSVSFVHSQLSGWTVISLIPDETLTAKAARIQKPVILAMLAAFVAIAVVGWVYNRRVVTPIRQITKQYQALDDSPGNTAAYRVPIRGSDEIAELSHWFNNFLDILEKEQQIEKALRTSLLTTKTMYEFSRAMIGSKDLPQLLQTVVDNLVTALSVDRVVLILVDTDTRQILHYVKGGPSKHYVKDVPYDELMDGLTGWVLREGQPVLSPKGQLDTRESAAVQKRRADTECGDIIVVPLIYGGERLGTLTAIGSPNDRDLSQVEIDLLTSLTNQATVAIVNTRLVDSLRESEAKFHTAFHASPEPISIISLKDGRFIDVNESLLNVTGYSRNEIIGKRWNELTIWANGDTQHRFQEMVIEQRMVRDFEAGILNKAGEIAITVLLSAEVIDLNGEQCVLTISKDITEHNRLERQRLELAMERERIQILSDFIAKASHEFKTPLSLINTKTYLASKTQDRDSQEAILGQIGEQVSTVAKLVDSLSLMAGLDSGDNDFRDEQFNLNDILKALHFSHEETFQAATLTCELHLDHSSLPVRGDMDYMKLAVEHLLLNAIKYTHAGGRVSISTRRENDKAIIEIQDTGIGIDTDELERIFERFYRVDKAGTKRGLGLGLPIAKAIIEQFDGSIEVESTIDVGSTFRVTFPLV
ncbi:MAG: PAS domain S-box protein [Anaerolineaceae bacterium]|nr:PAS domain S-box protein [Anaerolineaceae bacterium]